MQLSACQEEARDFSGGNPNPAVQWLSDLPLKLAIGFEPSVLQRQKRLHNPEHRTMMLRYLRKPSDVLAEGLLSKNSRGDRAAIELFCRQRRHVGSVLAAIDCTP
jgi:hypothetical protein